MLKVSKRHFSQQHVELQNVSSAYSLIMLNICRTFNEDIFISDNAMEDGWMICDFMSISSVFESYQNGKRVKMKRCGQRLRLYRSPGTTRSADKRLTH